MKCRNATENDAHGIANVLLEAYNIDTIEEGLNIFEVETKKEYHYIVALEDETVVGIISWQMHGLPKHQLCELDRIAVLSAHRRKGIAKLLLDALVFNANIEYETHGSKLRKLYLLTHADNDAAQRFYIKMGFEKEATLKEHFYKDVDEFVFSLFV